MSGKRVKIWIREHYLPENLPQMNWSLAGTFAFVALILLVIEEFGWQQPFFNYFRGAAFFRGESLQNMLFYAQAYTSLCFFVLMVLAPTLFHFVFPIKEKNLFGLQFGALTQYSKSYLPLLGIMLPALWFVSQSPNFYQFYPLYKPTTLSEWLIFEVIYMTQFFSVEFFFRGFLLFRIDRFLPGYSVFIMVIPYALLHLHKPFLEGVGSIIAGIVLGYLALKSRSIWPGVFVHCCVAFSTDLFSLFHSGRLGKL